MYRYVHGTKVIPTSPRPLLDQSILSRCERMGTLNQCNPSVTRGSWVGLERVDLPINNPMLFTAGFHRVACLPQHPKQDMNIQSTPISPVCVNISKQWLVWTVDEAVQPPSWTVLLKNASSLFDDTILRYATRYRIWDHPIHANHLP